MAKDGHGVAWLSKSLIWEDLDARKLMRRGSPAIDIGIVLTRAEGARHASAERFWQLALAAGTG